MGYRIAYTNVGQPEAAAQPKTGKPGMLILIVCILLCLAFCFSPVRRAVAAVIFPGMDEEAFLKMENLVREIRQGKPVGEAVTAFCREILADVQ